MRITKKNEEKEDESKNNTLGGTYESPNYPNDPNDPSEKLMNQVREAYNKLPSGWRRGNQAGEPGGYAPFIHEDGRKLWRHPCREEVMKVIQAEAAKHPDVWNDSTGDADQYSTDDSLSPTERKWLGKSRKMLKTGVPRGAVEQRIRVEGIDPDKILSLIDGRKMEGTVSTQTDNDAFVASDSSLSPKERKCLENSRKMLKSGIPRGAVEQRIRVEGVDPNKIFIIIDENKQPVPTNTPTQKNMVENLKASEAFFQVVEDDAAKNRVVEFRTDPNGRQTHIATLVKKMVQTIVKHGNAIQHRQKDGKSLLTVELNDLYNALGSIRGIKLARDMFNSTVLPDSSSLNFAEKMSKRKPFLEHLSALGIRAPTKSNAKADIEGLDELIQMIENEYQKTISSFEENYNLGLYNFDSLSDLFKPGTHVLAKNAFKGGIEMMCQVIWSRYEQGRTLFGTTKTFKVCMHFIFAVGSHFTLCEFVETIENFQGQKSLKNLDFIPLSTLDPKEVQRKKDSCTKRGIMYNKCATKATFLNYSKGSFYSKYIKGTNVQKSQAASGRIMIDTQGAYEAGHSLSVGYDPIIMAIKYKYKEHKLLMRQIRQNVDPESNSSAISTVSIHDHETLTLFDYVPKEFLHMTWPAVVGFSFSSKAWGDVLVDGLSEITFDSHIFDQLVLPPGRKRMIKALVNHSSDMFSDIISGKGEGSVFLFYGPPGVGKTLTAEAISEMLHRPLYSVALGQLGTTPSELETKLGEILELCGKWDALVLLDEADIFLEKRSSSSSLERNAMVSVMLRLVEYFKGVLFLTSNRVDSLDPAFKTRITLAVRYENLDVMARTKIWDNLLKASGNGTCIENGMIDVSVLANHNLNGREIKNAIRLAIALAKEDGQELSQESLLETISILCDFNEKMNSADEY